MSGTLNAGAASELRGTLKEKQDLNGTLKEKQKLQGIVASLGEDGGYYIPAVEQVDENTMQLSFAASKENMMPVAPQNVTLPAGYTPQKGKDYQDGKDGASVTVQSVEKSTEDGGSNVVTFSDGMKLIVKNGSKGSPGYTPVKGVDYDDGKDGEDGYTPVKGVDYVDGKDGYTPVKGTDYFTTAEIDAVVTQAAGKVTAESIGARPDTWMPSAADVGAHSNTWLPTIAEIGAAPLGHVEDISNPHSVTAEQVGARPDTWLPTIAEIGAAPSGYGLGAGGTLVTDWNDAKANGWYRALGSAANAPFPNFASWGYVTAFGSEDGIVQTAYTYTSDDWAIDGVFEKKRVYKSSTGWLEWEWVNPCLRPNTEYRTTERWRGKPVYAKVYDFGALPNDTYKQIAHNLTPTGIVAFYGSSTNGKYFLPSVSTSERLDLYINATYIMVVAKGNWSAVDAYITVKYTKD